VLFWPSGKEHHKEVYGVQIRKQDEDPPGDRSELYGDLIWYQHIVRLHDG